MASLAVELLFLQGHIASPALARALLGPEDPADGTAPAAPDREPPAHAAAAAAPPAAGGAPP